MVATSFHEASSAASVVSVSMARDALRAEAEQEYGEVRLHSTQMRFVTGVARAYEDAFPPELRHLVKEADFETAINQVNNTMKDYWPCFFCMCCGYACCPCTLGLSLLCPNLCIKDAEQYVRALMARINKRLCFERAGVEWRLVRTCGCSWIEITYPLVQKHPPTMTYQHQSPPLDGALSSSSASLLRVGSYGSHPHNQQAQIATTSAASPLVRP